MPSFFLDVSERANLLSRSEGGWRRPQQGALGAVLSHWSLAEGPRTVVSIPTGAGKTAVALAAPFLMASPPRRVLVLAPSRAVREQLADQFRSYEQLVRLGVFAELPTTPSVHEMSGRTSDWSALEDHDVIVALPNSVSPVHYDDGLKPPGDLFELLIVDEAHHAPADTWRAVLDHYPRAPGLLLTATPRRRDGRPIPGSLEYYYPLRRALDEGLYKPIQPHLLPPLDDRAANDEAIAAAAAGLLAQTEHETSVLLVRAGSIDRLRTLEAVYHAAGVELMLLHNQLGPRRQREIVQSLRSGQSRAVAVVGMLGEGFDLPAIRLLAYHDKHRSLPATAQLIGRLARVNPAFPQPSVLVTVADADVFPELKGVVRDLYEEDADWATVLPGLIDAEIQEQQLDREFADRFPDSATEVDPTRLRPVKRAFVYEVPRDWDPAFVTQLPQELSPGAQLVGGTVLYAGADAEARLFVIVVRYIDRPKWSSDPALSNLRYELHVAAHRRPPRVTLPGLLLLNLERDGLQRTFEKLLGLDPSQLAGPERLGAYLDSLHRISVSSVGIRNTNAATRGRATYRNFMGSGVDRGLRTVDLARSALGHVMFQINTERGTANAGGAVEKSKLWLARYGELREMRDWVDATAQLLWFPQRNPQGPLLPGVDRGQRLDNWPDARPLAAEIPPVLLGLGFELWEGETLLGALEDLELYVNEDPTGTLPDTTSARGGPLRIIGVLNDRANNQRRCVWDAEIDTTGRVTARSEIEVRRGYGSPESLSAAFEVHPPTIYFLDGTTTIGAVRYDSRALTVAFDVRRLDEIDWTAAGVDPMAETRRTAADREPPVRSIHEHLESHLLAAPRRGNLRWILCNDGAGEIADYLVLEELPSDELLLDLWHAKAAGGAAPSVRIGDFQVVVAQAIRSRSFLPSTQIWEQLGRRLTGQESPAATLVAGSDDEALLRQRLGIDPNDEDDFQPWTVRYPVVQGTIAIAQPGLSAARLREELAADPIPAGAAGIRQLFSVLEDTAVSDGAKLSILVSP